MRQYELMYILDPTLDEDASQALVGKIEGFIKDQGIEIESTEPWGKRRLAYRIAGHWDGNYVLSNLKCGPDSVAEMERRLRVTDGVLRFLTVRIDEQKAKAERRKAHREAKEVARQKRRADKAAQAGTAAPAAPPQPSATDNPAASQENQS